MLWSPLAAGDIFTSKEENAVELREVLKRLSQKYDCTMDSVVYAWHLARPLCKERKIRISYKRL